jgi:hypothetical protein
MIRNEVVDAVIPSPEQVLDLIVSAERHKKVVWTAGRLLKEMALWTRVEQLDYEERRLVLKRVMRCLEVLESQGVLVRRQEPQSIGYGDEIGFDYARPKRPQ